MTEREYSPEERSTLMEMIDKATGKFSEGEVVHGRIVAILGNDVVVDIGFKSEGIVPLAEFTSLEEVKVGNEVEVYLQSVEDKDGRLILSRKRVDFMRVWEKVSRAFETGEILQGRIARRIKGGMVVDLMGVEAFLPGSQIDVRPVRDFDSLIGKMMDFRVVKVNQPTENVVVSHRVIVEESLAGQRKAILEKLEKTQVLEGTVKAITDFGAFIDLGGVDGLVHITDLSWGRIGHPSEIVKLDQTVNVVVLDFDEAKKRISLGYKQLQPHPWENIETRYPVGTKINGKVVSLTDYGAFVEIEHGIEGLIHVSEMSWTQHIKHPSQVVSMGQMIDAVILSVDKDKRRISLGMKQLEPDPWEKIMEKYPVGSQHTGTVRNLTNFGVFVELEEGIDGLVHISDLSWTKKVRHPGELVKKGQRLDVVILGIDKDQRRISLGHKQVSGNPWDTFASTYRAGTETEGKIVRVIEKGVIVELPEGVDGFVPLSHLSMTPVKNIGDAFKVGDALPLKVIEFDADSKKIVLSVLEYLRDKEQKLVDEYSRKHRLTPVTMKDVVEVAPGVETDEVPSDSAAAAPAQEQPAAESPAAADSLASPEAKSEEATEGDPGPNPEANPPVDS
ncbi:MAG: 30S ribosomal protein S1 [Ignavibacteriales bacterium CG07_land_8_20_14_0_80_59_12]|nr:MAG: 30S ribosomal protein S1 [Ignavibacteriales bacterium CG07_land_8_20_14_0_80_59_12]